jgi:HD-like signal output (HDOD) protein
VRKIFLFGERKHLRDKLFTLLEQKGDLPPLPDVLLKLENHINDPNSDLESVAGLIQTDPVMQRRLIKLTNSMFSASLIIE